MMALIKMGSRHKPDNYRPVSLTSVEVIGKNLKYRINVHLERQELIKDNQHDSVRDRACLNNLIDFFQR